MGFSIDPRSLSPERRSQLDELFGDLTDQRASVDAITPGERGARIARLAAGLSDAGVDAYLCEGGATMRYLVGQATGRSERLVGLVIPASGDGAQDRLRPGMCFSNEPGIYLPGNLGLLIEDIMVVTADGADHFGTWQQGPESAA